MTLTRGIILTCLLAALLGACQKQGIYYWGDYSETYYQQTKTPCQETQDAHLNSLKAIVEQSKQKNLAVPPGVYAEYGYLMFKANKKDQAIEYFELEKSLYPESRIFMDRLIAAASQDKEDEPADGENAAKPLEQVDPSAQAADVGQTATN